MLRPVSGVQMLPGGPYHTPPHLLAPQALYTAAHNSQISGGLPVNTEVPVLTAGPESLHRPALPTANTALTPVMAPNTAAVYGANGQTMSPMMHR